MIEPQWQQEASPKKKSNAGLIVGIVVGVLGLAGGAVTALVVTLNDGGGGAAESGGDMLATAERFVQAYNKAVDSSDPAALPLDDYVCAANHDEVAQQLKDGTAQRYGLRLSVQAVTQYSGGAEGNVTMSLEKQGRAHRELSIEANRADGRWKLCGRKFDLSPR
ncbi:Rv0361 family membrane protein [Amycolatopsis sp. TRM77291]